MKCVSFKINNCSMPRSILHHRRKGSDRGEEEEFHPSQAEIDRLVDLENEISDLVSSAVTEPASNKRKQRVFSTALNLLPLLPSSLQPRLLKVLSEAHTHLKLRPVSHPYLPSWLRVLDATARGFFLLLLLPLLSLPLLPLVPIVRHVPGLLRGMALYRAVVARLCLLSLGVRLPTLPPLDPGFYFFSHMSSFDAFVMNALLPSPSSRHVTTLSKVEMLRIPFIGIFAAVSGCVTIDRGDRDASVRGMDECKARVSAGHAVMLSPEGTRSKTGQLSVPFKKGAFHITEGKEVRRQIKYHRIAVHMDI